MIGWLGLGFWLVGAAILLWCWHEEHSDKYVGDAGVVWVLPGVVGYALNGIGTIMLFGAGILWIFHHMQIRFT